MVSFFAEVDPTTKSFPTSVRQQLADEMGDPSTEVGAVLSATFVGLETGVTFTVTGDPDDPDITLYGNGVEL